ncbi:MAG: hypothetical protein VKO26_06715 [Cyanobacteriota bacterium]|nr:hypothetical protein [Cyanobacteriota bacterium]
MRRKLADLVAKRRWREALRAREQALRRHPELDLRPSEAQLWCLEGQQAAREGQEKRAEEAFQKALALGLAGDPHLGLVRLWVARDQTARAVALLEDAFTANRLPRSHAGAYLKLLLLAGEADQVRGLIRERASRFAPHQLQWAAGVLSLLDGDPASARRQFARMAGPPTPGDSGAVWRAWAAMEAGDPAAAATTLNGSNDPASVAVALDLSARGAEPPANLLDPRQRDLPRREQVLALALLHQLHQANPLGAARLLLAHERVLLPSLPELAALRRSLLLLAGQQASDQGSPEEALACWRPLVDRPAFDADLALRLYPILDSSDRDDHSQEALRLVSQLLSWVRRAARDDPSAWPEPLLSTTLARLHCWQADHGIRLARGAEVRRAVAQARQLAPEHSDVIARHGLLTLLTGDQDEGIALVWKALDGGCDSAFVYMMLESCLGEMDDRASWLRLRNQHGPRFGVMPPATEDPEGDGAAWLDALAATDAAGLAAALRPMDTSSGPLDALRILVNHLPLATTTPAAGRAPGRAAGRLPLGLPGASERWDALLAPLPPEEQVDTLLAILLAIHRFCRRGGKTIAGEIARRQTRLEQLAAELGTPHGERALRALLLLHGLNLKPSDAPAPAILALLRRASQPERSLPLALLDLRRFASSRPWRPLVEEWHRQEPQNPLLTLVLSTMERVGSLAWYRLSEEAFDLARRQQDGVALAACRREKRRLDLQRERAFSQDRPPGGGPFSGWPPEGFDTNAAQDIEDVLRRLYASTRGGGTTECDDDGEAAAPCPRPRRRRFMDL